jgi:hypothetical protein
MEGLKSSKRFSEIKCFKCGMVEALCLCSLIQPVKTFFRMTVLMHYKEYFKPSNTGRLVAACISDSELFVYGDKNRRFSLQEALCDDCENLILFPGGKDIAEYKDFKNKKLNIIIPDGSWNNALSVAGKLKTEYSLNSVSFDASAPLFRLRQSPEKDRLPTALAAAFLLKSAGETAAAELLIDIFEKKAERILWSRGKIKTSELKQDLNRQARDWKAGVRPEAALPSGLRK